MNKREQATSKRYEAAVQRLAKGESAADVYRAIYPRSKNWKPAALWSAASRLAAKVRPRVQDLQKLATAATITSIVRRKQILTDIASANPAELLEVIGAGKGEIVKFNKKSPHWRAVEMVKVRELKGKSTVVEIRFRDPSTAIEELNRMGGISPGKAG